MLPDFLVIGAHKGGSTSLWEYLRSHPSIYMPSRKELHFFDRDENWRRGVAWYEQQFAGADGALAVGEASPGYSRSGRWPLSPVRAKSVIPEARLVYVLRDPVQRIRSHYLHDRGLGLERRPFARAVLEDGQYVDASRYASQARRWLEHYPGDRLLLLLSEDLQGDRQATMSRVFAFLGVDSSWQVPAQDFHVTEGKRTRRPALRRLQGSAVLRPVLAAVPATTKARAKWSLARMVDSEVDTSGAELTEDLRAELCARLADDVAELRSLLGEGFHGWGIA